MGPDGGPEQGGVGREREGGADDLAPSPPRGLELGDLPPPHHGSRSASPGGRAARPERDRGAPPPIARGGRQCRRRQMEAGGPPRLRGDR